MPTAKQLKKEKRERNARAFGLLAFGFALGEWWYNVVNPEPNIWVGSLLLAGFIGSLVAAFTEYSEAKGTARIVLVCLGVLLFGGADYYQYHKQRAHQLEQVWEHLSATAEFPTSGNIFDSTFTLINGSGSTLTEHDLSCTPKLFRFSNGSTWHGGGTGDVNDSKTPLKPGSPQGDNCLANTIKTDAEILCADVVFTVKYEIADQPEVKQSKDFRFSASKRMGLVWHPEQAENRGTYCP